MNGVIYIFKLAQIQISGFMRFKPLGSKFHISCRRIEKKVFPRTRRRNVIVM